jgi:chloramphenicol 3-O-phosphotransferase
MNSKIVIINGPAGVGKTTVARKLALLGENSACIHGDDFKHYIVNRNLNTVATGLGYKNGATVANNFINGGYELVLFEYVFEDESHLPKFIDHLKVDCPVYLITLWANQGVVVDREANRSGRERLGKRVLECYAAMQQALGKLGLVIDTSAMSPDEVVMDIWRKLQKDEGSIKKPLTGLLKPLATKRKQ